MKKRWERSLARFLCLSMLASGAACCCNGDTAGSHPAGGGTPTLDQQEVLRFLKAHPALSPMAARLAETMNSGNVRGNELVDLRNELDSAARGFGYSSYRAYMDTAVRIGNIVSFLEISSETDVDMEPPTGIAVSEASVVQPYLEDVKRVEEEARRRASPRGRPSESAEE